MPSFRTNCTVLFCTAVPILLLAFYDDDIDLDAIINVVNTTQIEVYVQEAKEVVVTVG